LLEKKLHGVIIQSTPDFGDATGAKKYKCCSIDGLSGQTVTGDGNVEIFCTVFQRALYCTV
jgi:Na+-transporting NADH:ubiquinone oxidoreductase subunit NqrC